MRAADGKDGPRTENLEHWKHTVLAHALAARLSPYFGLLLIHLCARPREARCSCGVKRSVARGVAQFRATLDKGQPCRVVGWAHASSNRMPKRAPSHSSRPRLHNGSPRQAPNQPSPPPCMPPRPRPCMSTRELQAGFGIFLPGRTWAAILSFLWPVVGSRISGQNLREF